MNSQNCEIHTTSTSHESRITMPFIIPIHQFPATTSTAFCVTGSPCTSPRSHRADAAQNVHRDRKFGFYLETMNEKETMVSIPSTPILLGLSDTESSSSNSSETELAKRLKPNPKLDPKPTIHKGPTPRVILRKISPRQMPTLKTCDMKMGNFQMMWNPNQSESYGSQPLSVRPLRPRRTRARAKQFPLSARSTLHHRPGTPTTNIVPSTMRVAEFIMMRHTLGTTAIERLRRIFWEMDHADSGLVHIHQIVRLIILLRPSATVTTTERSVSWLFKSLSDKDGFITESQWLNAWTDSIKSGRYSTAQIGEFVDVLQRIKQNSNFIDVLNNTRCDHSLFSNVIRWKYAAMEQIKYMDLL